MADDLPEARVQLGRAAGQVEGVQRMAVEHLAQERHVGVVHALVARRPGVDVAVQAALVAAVGQVDLQGFQRAAAQGGKVQGVEQRQGGVHGGRVPARA
ncbi:hypothetical protein D3C78_1275930 [compost metagenome]